MDGALPCLAGGWGVGRHHVDHDSDSVSRIDGVLAQEALDRAPGQLAKLALADFTEITRRNIAMHRPLVILPGLEFVAARIVGVLRIAHAALITRASEDKPPPG